MNKRVSLSAIKLGGHASSDKPLLEEVSGKDIAIIGMAARLPGAADMAQFWGDLAAGKENVGEVPAGRKADIEAYLRFSGVSTERLRYIRGAFLAEIDGFDHPFFNISPREASLMNPVQRLFLETAWAAFEEAGYSPRRLTGTRTGVYVGLVSDAESYKYREMIESIDPAVLPTTVGGNLVAITPGRISYMLNLKGPSLVVDTACSSSLVSLHLACQALRNGECDMALAGGARVMMFPVHNEHQKMGIESSDERTMAFDDTADGSGVGEGVIALLLKPLHQAVRDGDQVHAVIKGSATNQDGSSMGITAPNPEAQSDVLIAAWKDAGIDPETISFVEAHGTGTRLGDPVEVEGLRGAFRRFTAKQHFCAVGSVKTNLGHLYACAGLAGVMKAVLALKHRQLPPHINFVRPNSQIDFVESPIYVNTRLMDWEPGAFPRRCGVSAFGFSGTNCHVVLEEAPATGGLSGAEAAGPHTLVLSARSSEALQELVISYRRRLESDPTLRVREVCFTAGTGRAHHALRLAIVASDGDDLRVKLAELEGADFGRVKQRWCYYGVHKVVVAPRGQRRTGELTQAQQESRTALAHEQMREFCKSGKTDAATLGEICSLYVSGAAVDWEELYRGESLQKVSLPTYPFARTRCWLTIPGAEAAMEQKPGAALAEAQAGALAEALAGAEQRTQGLAFFRTAWKRADLVRTGTASTTGAVLVLAHAENPGRRLAERLQAEGRDVVVATAAGAYARQAEDVWRLSGSEADYVQLLSALRERGISQILHAIAWEDHHDLTETRAMPAHQDEALLSLYRLVRSIAATWPGGEVSILVVSPRSGAVTEADQIINPHHTALQGLAQAVRKDLPQIRCKSVDVDELASARAIVDELHWGLDDARVAYRQSARFVPEFGFYTPAASEIQEISIKEEGAYLITGGLGGIGLELARYLVSRNNRAKIALLGRSGLPPREQWAGRAAGDAKVARAVAAIAEMEALGAEISVLRADVADAGQMAAALTHLRGNYGRIAGVIHAAGVGKLAALMEQPESDFRAVISPKTAGTCVLDALTRQDRPDFFILCSSVASIFTAPHQCGYAAANAFLDAYAAYRSASGLPTLAINWTTWKETGMAADQGLHVDTMFKAMVTEQALAGFAAAVNWQGGHVLVGELNLTRGGARLMQRSGVRLSADLEGVLATAVSVGVHLAPPRTGARPAGAVKLVGRESEAYTATERFVAEVCREMLGYNHIDVDENFFEMGADSIILTAISKRLADQYPGMVEVTHLFEHSTVAKLAQYLVAAARGPAASARGGPAAAAREVRAEKRTAASGDIAIIGIGAKLPGADSLDQFWENISGGVNSVSRFPEQRRKDIDRYLAFKGFSLDQIDYLDGAYLADISAFDYQYFRIAPREATFMDPHQRLLLETAWHAIEDAGYGGGKLSGTDTGVYFTFSPLVRDMYAKLVFDIDPGLMSNSIVGNAASVAAGRISYMLDLHGPSMVLDTACSSALVALDTACQAIRAGKCSMALVGSIKLITVPAIFSGQITGIGMDSSDGLTRTFDQHANGTAFGEGVEVILIKPLEQALADGDQIQAVIKGSAVNQDGASAGITAPNPEAQVAVILRAWDDAGVDPESVTYIEAHGSGTPLGDPIEISSIQTAFRKHTDKQHFCGVGAVKTNLGHLAEGAGMAGLIKCVLAMQHKEIPGNLNFNRPSNRMELIDSPVYVNTKRRRWEPSEWAPRRCGVSAFGMSGTNSHVVLEEHRQPDESVDEVGGPQLLTVSARTPAALSRLLDRYRLFLRNGEVARLSDLCYTASTGRGHYACRMALVVDSVADLHAKIERISGLNPGELREAEICYGDHKIVPVEKEVKAPGELTDQERYQLTAAAAALIDRGAATGAADRTLLAEIGALYVRGADPDWEQLYAGQLHRKVRLPVYPFEPTRCWLEAPAGAQAQAEAIAGLGTPFCTMTWHPRAVLGAAKQRNGTAILFQGAGSRLAADIADQIRSRGMNVVHVRTGQSYERVDANLFTMAEVEDDYRRLFAELADCNVTLILHASMLSQGIACTTAAELETRLRGGVYSALNLTRTLVASDIAHALDLYVIAPYVHDVTGREEQISAENGALFGLVKSIGLEHPQITVRAIDTDDATTAEQVLSELDAESNLFASAYRDGVRYVEQLTDLTIDSVPRRDVAIKQGGVYLITGGLGGIGSMLARHLASRYAATLVLVNRAKLPDRRDWDALLAAGGDATLARRIGTIRELEALGSEVAYYAADVSRSDELGPVLADVRRRFGRIDGVIHAAGVANPGILLRKSDASFNAVLDPKVRGTWLLDRLTAEDDLDFFVLFSSGVTFMGEAGQADYVAANYYLDSYAASRNRWRKHTLSIDWVSWAEAGMSVAFGIDADTLFKVLSPAKAIAAFEQLLARDLSRVLVGEFNTDDANEVMALGAFPCELSDRIRGLVANAGLRIRGRVEPTDRADAFIPLATKRKMAQTGAAERVTLTGRNTQDYGVIEEQIAQIYSDALGFRNINIYDSFFELGGDSIMLSRMHLRLEKEFPGIVKLVELFEHTSVSKLAQHVKERLEPRKPAARPEGDQQAESDLRSLIEMMQAGEISVEEALDSMHRKDK